MDWKEAVRKLKEEGQVIINKNTYRRMLELDVLPDQTLIRRNNDGYINLEIQ